MTHHLRLRPLALGLAIAAAAVAPALAGPAEKAGSTAAAQVASRSAPLDLNQIESRLYEQGYHRISHLRMQDGLYSARALDDENRPVFLGVSAATGKVTESLPLD
ncbi:MAG: PepSY domain-containing protein [Alphaproteobacteria bacterium]|nr:PepSY domain-containing protein [Alphaproteobacteria bacterium]